MEENEVNEEVKEEVKEEVVEENVAEHAKGDVDKWNDVFSRLDALEAANSALISRLNDVISQGAIINDGTGDLTTGDTEEVNEVDQMDSDFYERQKRYLI